MLLPYVASKGAIFALTRARSREMAGSGITVNCVTPGFTLTEGAQAMADAQTISHIRSRVLEQQIVKRGQERGDVTGALVFLVSAESDFITGQTINVDGGAIHY
jgi:3-oxoacyl-[acyl-carrier protein] reductase